MQKHLPTSDDIAGQSTALFFDSVQVINSRGRICFTIIQWQMLSDSAILSVFDGGVYKRDSKEG